MNTLKQAVKKAIAVGSGSMMLGATLIGATALDLNEYPAPFVKNGMFDGVIVVGEKAATSDVVGAIDLAASLQAASTVPVGGGSSRTVVTGDAAQIGDSGDMLEIGEQIGAVTETLTDDDLEMLRDGTITTSAGTTDFTQLIELDGTAAGSGLVKLDEPSTGPHDDETGMYLYYAGGAELFSYEVEFTSGLESSLEQISGANYAADDLEDEAIFMLGTYYTIVDSTVVTGGPDDITLELIAGDVTDTLSQGETKTYTLDGKEYEVTVLAIGSSGDESTVKFLVNGEVTDSMQDGDTEQLADGLEIGVRDIIEVTAYRESDPSSIVEFYLGANKIEITDTNVAVQDGAGTVEINEETIEDANADIVAVITGTTDVRINSIIYALEVDAEDGTNLWVGAGEGVREQLDEPEGMLNANWDVTFEGLSEPDMSEIRFVANGDEAYDLEFTNRRGDDISVPYYHAQGAGNTDGTFGDETDTLVFWEIDGADGAQPSLAIDYPIDLDDYFVVTDTTAGVATEDDDTYVLQFTDVNEDDNELTFDVVGGDELTATYSGTVGADPAANNVTGDIRIGGKDFQFWMYEPTAGDYRLAVDLDNDGVNGNQSASGDGVAEAVDVVTRGGGILKLIVEANLLDNATNTGGLSAASWNAQLTTVADDLDSDAPQATNVTFTETAAEVDLALAATGTGTYYRVSDSDADTVYATNAYGTWFEATDETDESDSLTISYPMEQVEALVYVVGGDVSTSVSSTAGATRVNPINVGAAVLDKDVTVDQDNMIVVGGPCANTIAAELLDAQGGNCAEGFTEGHAMIKLFDTGANVALLIAGYDAADTVAASRVVAEYADYNLEGMEVDVVSASGSNIQVNRV